MRGVPVVAANVFTEQPHEMAIIYCVDLIQQVPTAALDSMRRRTVLPWTFRGYSHRAYSQETNGHWDIQPIFRIPADGSNGNAFGICRMIEPLVGCSVTL